MIRQLSRTYACRFSLPVVDRIDTAVFNLTYCSNCMEYSLCSDVCCSYGADIDSENIERIRPYADALEAYTGTMRVEWFRPGFISDGDFPGGRYTRTRVKDGRCVFLNRNGRGCLIHSFCLENGMDFHILKPMVSSMFPITFHEGLLRPSNELLDGSLSCRNERSSLYRGARGDLEYYFGNDLIEELDAMERE